MLWLVLSSSGVFSALAQEGGDELEPFDDGVHETLLHLNSISSIVNATGFTVSGFLIDSETGEQLSGKEIRFEVTPAIEIEDDEEISVPELENTKTVGIKFEDEEGVQVNACYTLPELSPGGDETFGTDDDVLPECAALDTGDTNDYNQVLYLHMGAKIILPEGSAGVILTLQDMGNNQLNVTATVNANGTETGEYAITELSTGQYPYATNFHITAPTGIKEIKIESVGNVTDGIEDLVGISAIRTFDPASEPIGRYHADFEDLMSIDYGNQTEVNGGTFMVDAIAPERSSNIAFNVTAFFDGDENYLPAASNVQKFFVYPASFGGGGGGATILPDYGTGITTTVCGGGNDDDKDGICDPWETGGIPYTNGTGQLGYYSLSRNGAGAPSASEVDLYVEIDNMIGHTPMTTAITGVQNAFEARTYGGNDIDFHYDTDETDLTEIAASGGGLNVWVDPSDHIMDTDEENDFFYLKKSRFGTSAERVLIQQDAAVFAMQDSSLSDGIVKIRFSGTSIISAGNLAANGGVQGKIVITAQVRFFTTAPCSGPSGPGTLTPSVQVIASAGSLLDAGTPSATISSPTGNTRRVTLTIPISPNGNISEQYAGTYDVTLTRSGGGTTLFMCPSVDGDTNTQGTPTVYITNSLLDAKAQVYHYALWVDSIGPAGPSGVAEVNGNDLIVSLGQGFTNPNGSLDEQKGTFMHELGHNLNLDHGGPRYLQNGTNVDPVQYSMNCKPNYISVMTYSLQFPIYLTSRPLDFSSDSLSRVLNENDVDESSGLKSSSSLEPWIVFGKDGSIGLGQTYYGSPVEAKIDWNMNSYFGNNNMQLDVNDLSIRGCGLDDNGVDNSILGETLTNYNDWVNLEFDFKLNAGSSMDGISPVAHKQREITPLTYLDMKNQVAEGLVSDRSEPEWYSAAIILGAFAALAGAAFIFVGPYFGRGKDALKKMEEERKEEEERKRRRGASLPG